MVRVNRDVPTPKLVHRREPVHPTDVATPRSPIKVVRPFSLTEEGRIVPVRKSR
jgi:hypothetical protein